MLAQIRAFAKSPIATALMVILVGSFAFWGIRDVFRPGALADVVVQAPGRAPITPTQFHDIFNEQKAKQEQSAGQSISTEEAVKHGFDKTLLDGMASTEATAALIASEGVRPADKLIAAEIRKNPGFFNPITGAFDQQAYLKRLSESHVTPEQADGIFRDQISQQHYGAALAAGLRAPRIYGLVDAAVAKEARDFTWFALAPSAVAAPVKPTDAQLTAFVKENAAAMTKPETRQLSIVHMSAAELAKTVAAPEADVQKRFDFEKDTLSQPEKRTIVLIPVKDAATGAAIAAKLKAGADPQVVAKAAGLQALISPAVAKSAVPDPKVADAAFALKAGEVAGPVQGSLGMSVLKVIDVTAPHAVTLAEARPKIEGEVKQEVAKEKIYDLVQKYDDAHSGGSQMPDAAKAASQVVIELPPITAAGVAMTGQRVNLPPKVLQTAFTLGQGQESETIDLGQGDYWVVKVVKLLPPALIALDETIPSQTGGPVQARVMLTQQFMIKDLFTRLKAKADAVVTEIKNGKTMAAAAAEVGAKPVVATGVLRSAGQATQPGQPPAYAPDLIGQLFTLRPGDVFEGRGVGAGPSLVIAKLDHISVAAGPILAGLAEAERPQLTRTLFQDQGAATRLAAMRKMKPTIDYRKAREALGLDPITGKPKS